MHDGYDDGAMACGVVVELVIALAVMIVLFLGALWFCQ